VLFCGLPYRLQPKGEAKKGMELTQEQLRQFKKTSESWLSGHLHLFALASDLHLHQTCMAGLASDLRSHQTCVAGPPFCLEFFSCSITQRFLPPA